MAVRTHARRTRQWSFGGVASIARVEAYWCGGRRVSWSWRKLWVGGGGSVGIAELRSVAVVEDVVGGAG